LIRRKRRELPGGSIKYTHVVALLIFAGVFLVLATILLRRGLFFVAFSLAG
jgi:hypothetical protein